jgi:hypothetical protein
MTREKKSVQNKLDFGLFWKTWNFKYFMIFTLYEEIWWHVSMCNKLNQSKFERYFFPNFSTAFLYYFIWKHCFIVSDSFIVYNLIFENFAVQAWTISILEGCISYLSKRKSSIQKSKLSSRLIDFTCKIHFVLHHYVL